MGSGKTGREIARFRINSPVRVRGSGTFIYSLTKSWISGILEAELVLLRGEWVVPRKCGRVRLLPALTASDDPLLAGIRVGESVAAGSRLPSYPWPVSGDKNIQALDSGSPLTPVIREARASGKGLTTGPGAHNPTLGCVSLLTERGAGSTPRAGGGPGRTASFSVEYPGFAAFAWRSPSFLFKLNL